MSLSRWCFFSLLCFFSSAVFSQDTITPPPKPQTPVHISYVREIDIDNFDTLSYKVDSSLATFHRSRGFLYDITKERNIFMEEETPFRKHVVNFSDDLTLPFKFSDRTIRYYKLNKRFTEITYLLGPKKEQLLNVVYTQNLMKGWSIGLDFRRAGAEGWYKRQQFYQSSFDVFTHYESPNERYQLYAYYLRNRLEQQENGGINNFDPAENTVAQPTYLSTAENNQTDKGFLLRQQYYLSNLKNDSAARIGYLGHSVAYESRGRAYFDSPADSFYTNAFFDSTLTSDTTWYQRWTNKIFYSEAVRFLNDLSANGFLSVGHEYLLFKENDSRSAKSGMNGQREKFFLELGINFQFKSQIELSVYARNILHTGIDLDLSSVKIAKAVFSNRYKIFASVNSESRKSGINIVDERMYSNHFMWFNNFDTVMINNYQAGIFSTDKSFLLSGSLSMADNFIYYDSTAHPKQSEKSISYYKLKLQKNFTWRSWIFENTIEYQKADDEDILHLPEWMTGHSLCYEKYFFKSALFARIGMDVRYVSSYYADRYMPALQEFYLQYDKKTGGYVLADFFITFRVKASRFFIKMENLFNGVSAEPQFFRPDYPLTPRYLRFGLQLRFFD
jgi:hypothetical protein